MNLIRLGVELQKPVRRMYCSCCGAVTRGRQWPNRDTGYGLCNECIDYCHRNETDADFERLYGVRGIHYDIPAITAWTGGDRPRALADLDPAERQLVHILFTEQCAIYAEHWGALEWEAARIFWTRARYDAHSTLRRA